MRRLAAALVLIGAGGPSSEKKLRRSLPFSAAPENGERDRVRPTQDRPMQDRTSRERPVQDRTLLKSAEAGPRKSKAAAAAPKYLGKGVSKVRFTDGAIVVEFKNGALALFDAAGNPLKPAVKAAAATKVSPPAPSAIPPPPTSPPGN